jgi:predicted GIY-YIG superfamily endonuclease
LEKGGYVYILASKRNGTLYVGVTSDLARRVWKLSLIEETNPGWQDLYETLTGSPLSRG